MYSFLNIMVLGDFNESGYKNAVIARVWPIVLNPNRLKSGDFQPNKNWVYG